MFPMPTEGKRTDSPGRRLAGLGLPSVWSRVVTIYEQLSVRPDATDENNLLTRMTGEIILDQPWKEKVDMGKYVCPKCGADNNDNWPITVGEHVEWGGCQECWETECSDSWWEMIDAIMVANRPDN